ncbi:glycoside hydrolase superfamily [Thelonectria olida]|uniref:Glycoside hydrolase superfamily n=1 Tax=Thelonectria olida TaxID=1576542 RepID=A0A9P9AR42_9HYPO|nr:glycoside hydrolase superfamily [Thelonectria olida]
MGYDITNYEDINPPYGTLQDMEQLIQEVHCRGMKIMLDLVINHTSDQHAWFKESRASRTNGKSDWCIWRPPHICSETDGLRLPPNNCRSCVGNGSVWQWDEMHQGHYFHLYAKEMPDLNWENEECRKAIFESAVKSWLRRGVDGENSAKMLALMQVCLTGTQYVCQGQESGSVNAPKESYPLENYVDVNSMLCIQDLKERHGNDLGRLKKTFTGLQYLARDHA